MTNKLLEKKLSQGYEIHKSETTKIYIMQTKGKKYSKNTFPIIASYVTSYALIQMHIKIKTLNPLYMDTDSIITQTEIKEDIDNKLGHLKMEKMGLIHIDAPKCYLFNNEVVIKGINMRGLPIDERIKIYYEYIKGNKINQKRFMKIKGGLKSLHYIPNEIIEYEKCKKLTCESKRIFDSKGLSKPIEIKPEKIEVPNEREISAV
jgi:hypothetical protein